MASRFAALASDDSDSDMEEQTMTMPVSTSPANRVGGGNIQNNINNKAQMMNQQQQLQAQHQQQLQLQAQQQQQFVQTSMQMQMSNSEQGEFCAVSKKKAHSGKVNADALKKAGESAVVQDLSSCQISQAHTAAGTGGNAKDRKSPSPRGMNVLDHEQMSFGDSSAGGSAVASMMNNMNNMNAHNNHASSQSPGKKKKKVLNSAFACLVDDDSGDEEESDEEEDMEVVQVAKPVLPNQLGLTNQNQSNIPDYFAVTHIETTQPTADDVKNEKVFSGSKKFKPEVVLYSVLFVNTKTKKVEHEFTRVVQPTDFPSLNQATTELLGLTDEKLVERKAQPLDEVMREFERFVKERNLVSSNRNKKRASNKFTNQELEFQVITSGPEIINESLRTELARKGLQQMSYFKKWVDVKKIFADLYNMAENPSLHEILDKICMEFEGSPHMDDGRNIVKIVVCMLNDSPHSLVCNQVAK